MFNVFKSFFGDVIKHSTVFYTDGLRLKSIYIVFTLGRRFTLHSWTTSGDVQNLLLRLNLHSGSIGYL